MEYKDDPLALSPAVSNAITSAWARPGGRVYPSAMMLPFLTSTAPTAGFGLVVPRADRANSTARSMGHEGGSSLGGKIFMISASRGLGLPLVFAL